jgi:hypothetical protein
MQRVLECDRSREQLIVDLVCSSHDLGSICCGVQLQAAHAQALLQGPNVASDLHQHQKGQSATGSQFGRSVGYSLQNGFQSSGGSVGTFKVLVIF